MRIHSITVTHSPKNSEYSREIQKFAKNLRVQATQLESATFLVYVHQKSVNARQIIPLFTIVWDDGSQRAKGRKTVRASKPHSLFLFVLMPFQNLARVHDEATT